MKIRSLVKEKVFIPKIWGNEDLKKEDQIIVNIKKFPSVEDLGKIKAFKYDADGNVMINYNNSFLLKSCVGSIKGIELDEGTTPITNGSSLATTEELVLEELVSAIREHLLETSEVLTQGEN